jgi:eukaryotic-like serine/threonine-protein kinase
MSGALRVERLIEEILDSDCTPEEACGACPELLPWVMARLGQIRAVDGQFDALFPTPGSCPPQPVSAEASPPHFPGFEVRKFLGRGGMGIVYRAWDQRLRRDVAIKMLIAGAYARPEELERFLRGAEAKAGLRHPNIVQVYDVGDLDGRPYFTMEFVEGGSLAQRLAGAPMPPGEAAVLVATLADAVQAAHDGGIIHRDLKPANVLLTADGTPKVTDFGLARRLDGGAGLTQTGDTLGTPSYMAPEQAQGKSNTVGPAADVYALGAILYESLTGRPPFRSETAAETIRQVIDNEPVPPSRLNARVARDLETICLKCLSKAPGERYPSAAALAEDLRRFRRGEAITARSPGRAERLARWLRRRRSQAAVVAVGTLMTSGLVGGWLRLWSEEHATARGIEHDLREVAVSQHAADWSGAAIALERARGRLSRGGPAELRRRLDQAGRGLDHARRDHILVNQLDAIRLARMTLAEGHFNPGAERRFNNARAARAYEAAFREARVGAPDDDPAGLAARVAASTEHAPILAALDDWAVCAADDRRRDWVLAVARRADPDAWRDRARDPAAWRDQAALTRLAESAPLAAQPASLLGAVGERLHAHGGDGTAFLARVYREHPDDFWVALTLARALQEGVDPEAAVAPYRRALELRGESAAVYSNLGLIPHPRRDWREAYDRYEKALAIDRDFAPAHNNLGLALKGEGRWDEAIHHFREAIRLDPELAPAHYNLAEIRAYQAGLDEALIHYGQALRIDPAFALAEYMLGVALAGEGRLDEAVDRNRRAVQIDPADAKAHAKTFGQAVNEGLIHYHRTLELDPQLSLSRNNVGLGPRDADRLNQAIGHYEKALRLDPGLFRAHASLGQARLALGRFRDAEAATRRCLDGMPRDHELRANVLAQLRRCERLIALEDRLPAVLRGDEQPGDVAKTLEFAELCGIRGQLVAAARLYADALATSPQSAEDLHAEHRYRAACAAALVGCDRGGDGADLSREERARWRGRAREWLRAEVTLWTKALDGGPQADRLLVRNRLTHLWADPDLAVLFDHDALDKLPPAERQECRTLWGEVDALIRRAQTL